MSWPYHLLDLSHEEKHHRRLLLDRYGVYAQLSALIPILVYRLYRLGVWVSSERQRATVAYEAVPSSPRLKQARASRRGVLVKQWRQLRWWLGSEVMEGWGLGQRSQWVAAMAWGSWLGFLCVHRTGEDYLHITKRFGVIAASQFPIHYALSMKSIYSPLGLAFGASHEQLNSWHRVCGRAIYTLLLLHVAWYLNYFVLAGVLYVRLTSTVVIIGILAFSLMSVLVTTSLEPIRRWSYRVFFICHLTIGVILLPLLFFHAAGLRIYVTEALVLFLFDIICRKLDTVTGFATITSVPNSKLVKLDVPIPEYKIWRFQAAPGQHVYLQIPPESVPMDTDTPMIHELLFNPFTVASVSEKSITLVLRSLSGPATRTLEKLSRMPKARPPIKLEGPLGTSQRFPNFAHGYDRVLLAAGGIGSTFILPIYKNVKEALITEGKSPDRATFIWSTRSASETLWAADDSLQEDDNVRVFYTGAPAAGGGYDVGPADGSVELEDLQRESVNAGLKGVRGRADIQNVVDDVFQGGNQERVAVLVCGPKGMARSVRSAVGVWVGKGRDVWYHDEGFGW